MAPFFDELHAKLISNFLTRNVGELFSSNCGVSHYLYTARCINELIKGNDYFESRKMLNFWLLSTIIRKLAKNSFFLVFCVLLHRLVDQGGQRGYVTQALTPWQHTVAFSEAQDVRHQAKHPASHHHFHMVIKMARDFSVCIVIDDSITGHNHS